MHHKGKHLVDSGEEWALAIDVSQCVQEDCEDWLDACKLLRLVLRKHLTDGLSIEESERWCREAAGEWQAVSSPQLLRAYGLPLLVGLVQRRSSFYGIARTFFSFTHKSLRSV